MWHCVMRMRLHSRRLANPQQLHATRNQPRSFFYGSTHDARYTPSTSSSAASQPAQHRVMRFQQKLTPRRPRDAFHTRQPVHGSLASLASAARGQTSSSPDCSSTAPTTPSHSFSGPVYEPAIEDCPAPLTLALLSLPPT